MGNPIIYLDHKQSFYSIIVAGSSVIEYTFFVSIRDTMNGYCLYYQYNKFGRSTYWDKLICKTKEL